MDFCFLVVGDGCWGKGKTIPEAMRKACKEFGAKTLKKYLVYLGGPGCYMDEFGYLCTLPGEQTPMLVDCGGCAKTSKELEKGLKPEHANTLKENGDLQNIGAPPI